MRRFLMWMMICLLPLRLWAGDAMAVQHTQPAAHAAVLVAAQDAHPCHGTDAAATEAAAGTDKASNTAITEHGSTCGDCSVCHGPLAGLALPTWAAPALPDGVPQALGWSALSASALPHLKPPRA
jgi:mono/diheme cytochrome c family protein